MAAINFSNFTLATPRFSDFLVGYRGTSEIRTTINSITSLNVPFFNRIATLTNLASSYNSVYSSFNQLSVLYSNTYLTVNTTSGNWNNTYNYVNSTSADIDGTLTYTKSIITVLENVSANWDYGYFIAVSAVPAISALNATQAVFQTSSARYEGAYTVANAVSASVTRLQTNSAGWDASYSLWTEQCNI